MLNGTNIIKVHDIHMINITDKISQQIHVDKCEHKQAKWQPIIKTEYIRKMIIHSNHQTR